MGNLDFDAWSDGTDGDTNNGSLDSGGQGNEGNEVRVLRSGIVRFG